MPKDKIIVARCGQATKDKLRQLGLRYGSQSAALLAAIHDLWQREFGDKKQGS